MWPPGRREAGDYLFAKSPPSRSRQRTWVPPRGRGPARSSRCRAPDGSTPCDSALALCRLQPRPNIRTLRHRRHHALVLLRIGDAVGTTPSASPKPRRLMSNSEAAASARGISCYCCCSRTAARTHRTSLCRATHRTSLCRAGSWIQMVDGFETVVPRRVSGRPVGDTVASWTVGPGLHGHADNFPLAAQNAHEQHCGRDPHQRSLHCSSAPLAVGDCPLRPYGSEIECFAQDVEQ